MNSDYLTDLKKFADAELPRANTIEDRVRIYEMLARDIARPQHAEKDALARSRDGSDRI